MKIYSGTDKGLVRAGNQDACCSGTYSEDSCWAVVCDGMGGANAGDVAAGLATEIIAERLTNSYRDGMSARSAENLLVTSINAANITVYDASREDKSLEGMGTTVVAVVITEGAAVIAHVGDSRAYLLSSGKLIRLTKDHSYVQTLLDSGKISQEEAEEHPYKNIITRALGIDENIDIDCSHPEFTHDSVLLLCSDGLTNFVSEERIKEALLLPEDTDKAQKLIELANRNGGGDNITAVVITN